MEQAVDGSVQPQPLPFKVVDGGGVMGKCCVALRPIKRGELVLCEQPLAVAQDDGPGQGDGGEWRLARALLDLGKGAAWARQFVCTKSATFGEPDDVVRDLAKGRKREDVLAVYRAVCNNAFALHTTVLRVRFGVAFYELAARLNHSCAPSCVSLRLGGNMAVFAAQDIAQGCELTHAYTHAHWMANAKARRAEHLHFACACARCEGETESLSRHIAALHFPPGHAQTDQGRLVVEFKMATLVGSSEKTLAAGDALLVALAPFLVDHPLAALELLDQYLTTLFEELVANGGATPPATQAALASALLYRATTVVAADQRVTPPTLAVPLRATAAIVRFLLDGGLRSATVPDALAAVRALQELFGGTPLFTQEDMAFVDKATGAGRCLSPPGLRGLCAVAMGQVSEHDSQILMDACAHPSCRKQESPSQRFPRCARCKAAKYCSAEHQRSHWKSHKPFCHLVSSQVG